MNDREKFEEVYWSKHGGDVIKKPFRREANKYLVPYVEACWFIWQAATAESDARIAELEQKLVEISSLMTLWKKGLLTGDELGKSLFVVHESKPAITKTGDKS